MKVVIELNGEISYVEVYAANHPKKKDTIVYAFDAAGKTFRKECSVAEFRKKLRQASIVFNAELSPNVEDLDLDELWKEW